MSSPRRVPSSAPRITGTRITDGPQWIEQVREWANIHLRTLLHDYAPDAFAKLRGDRCPCPMHGGTNLSLALYDNHDGPGELWHCHSKCGTSGGGVELVAALTNRDRMDVLRELAPRAGIYLDASMPRRAAPPAVSPPSPPRVAPTPPPTWWETDIAEMRAGGMTMATGAEMHTHFFSALTLGPLAVAELERRGFDAEDTRTYGFRSVENAETWQRLETFLANSYSPAERARVALDQLPTYFFPALLIPYRSPSGLSVLGFNCRALTPTLEAKFDKYRKPKGAKFPVPFNAPALEGLSNAETLHLIEGELNAYTLHCYGERAVSLGSAGGSAAIAETIAPTVRAAGRVVLWFDDDAAGEKGFRRLCEVLARHITAAEWQGKVFRHRITKEHDADAKDANDLHRAGVLASVLKEAAWR